MQGEQYQVAAMRTCKYPAGSKRAVLEGTLGLNGEAGEIADLIKKATFHGHPSDKEKLILELGDVLWYVAECAHGLGVSMNEVMARNIQKLETRYPTGFTTQASLARVDQNASVSRN